MLQELVVSKLMRYLWVNASKVIKDLPTGAGKDKDEKRIGDIDSLNFIREKLWYLTKFVSYFESIFVASVAYLSIIHKGLFEGMVMTLYVIAAWMAIKVFGNYGQWADSVVGRVYYYIFIIGSILNISIAVIVGCALSYVI